MNITNPFLIYGYVSPEYFCDRVVETRDLSSALYNGRNITLMSPRRIGKTGLIHNTFHTIRETRPEAACFYVDIYATQCLADFTKLFGETVLGQMDLLSQKVMDKVTSLLSHCKISFTSDKFLGGTVTLSFEPENTEATLRDIFAYIKDAGRECYIAFDEFQQVSEYPEKNTEALLRTYIQLCPEIHFIFAGSKSHLMSEMFDSPRHPFYHSTEKMHLDAIAEDEYYQFAQHHLNKVMTVLPREVFHSLYDTFHGHTWYVQYLFNKIYEQAPAIVDDAMVRECLKDILQRNKEEYSKLTNLLTANQRELLKAIAKEHSVQSINSSAFINRYNLKGASSVNKALQFLLDKEYVYRYNEGYQVYDRFYALWLREL